MTATIAMTATSQPIQAAAALAAAVAQALDGEVLKDSMLAVVAPVAALAAGEDLRRSIQVAVLTGEDLKRGAQHLKCSYSR